MWVLQNLKAYPTSESLLSISAPPSSRRNRAIASRFSSAKTYRVLLPSASLMFTSAPWLSRLCTTSQCPSMAASLWRTKWLLCYILYDNTCTILSSLPSCLPIPSPRKSEDISCKNIFSSDLNRVNSGVEKSLLRINSYQCEFQWIIKIIWNLYGRSDENHANALFE